MRLSVWRVKPTLWKLVAVRKDATQRLLKPRSVISGCAGYSDKIPHSIKVPKTQKNKM
jgi:hypothetical protein